MDRRRFIKNTCTLCAALSVASVAGSLSSCAALPLYKTSVVNNKITVPLSKFEKSDLQLIQPQGLDYDIALQKEKNGGFTALLLRCTHHDNQLTPTGKGYKCYLHGSAFDQEGQVVKGPAEQPLKKYRTEVTSDQLIIHLP